MKAFAVFAALVVAVAGVHDSCYSKLDEACSAPNSKGTFGTDVIRCNATYGHAAVVMHDLVHFANSHLVRSFEYLLMSTHYGNYIQNRPGFEKLFRDLSDSKWDKTIDLIKHITTRGGVMSFEPPKFYNNEAKKTYELYEIQSVAKALDVEKDLAVEAFHIHKEANARSDEKHDPEISSFLEKEFVHEHAKTVRKLAGHVTDLKSLLSGKDGSLALYLFDEYLQKE